MAACQICDAPATREVRFEDPTPQEFTVCDTHAEHAVENGATVRDIA